MTSMNTSKKRRTGFFDSFKNLKILDSRRKSNFRDHQKSLISEKRGQFYLAAAIIIALVIFSLATISNYAKESISEPVVFDLKSELNLETGRVVDFAIYNKNDTLPIIENWTRLYVESQQGKDVENYIFVFGTYDDLTRMDFTEGSTGEVCNQLESESSCIHTTTTKITVTKPKVSTATSSITITLGDFSYDFNIKSGQNFAFVIQKEGYVADSSVKDD